MNSQGQITSLPQRSGTTDMTLLFTDVSLSIQESLIQVLDDVISSITGCDTQLFIRGNSIAWEGGAEYISEPILSFSLDVTGEDVKNFWASSEVSIISHHRNPVNSSSFLDKKAYVFNEWQSKSNLEMCLDYPVFVVSSEPQSVEQDSIICLAEQMDFNFLAAFSEVTISREFLENENYLKQLIMLKFCYSPVIKFLRPSQ